MNTLVNIVRWLVGGLFIFSGGVKIVDPVGTSIKLQEYFDVFGIEFLKPAALFLSVFLVVFEVVIGVMLIVGLWKKFTLWALLLMILYFTILTFYSAVTGKVTDCGCFGDFLKLEPWESFYKDIILTVLILFLFINRKRVKSSENSLTSYGLSLLALVFSLFIAVYAIIYLPPIDFRAYKVGTDLKEATQPQEDPEYLYVFDKNGERIESKEYISEPGYEYDTLIITNEEQTRPKIEDFALWNDTSDYTKKSLEGKKLFFMVGFYEKADKEAFEDAAEMAEELKGTNIEMVALTSSPLDKYDKIARMYNLNIPAYLIDEKVLKTIIRSNPGYWLLDDGVVKAKWSHNSEPEAENIRKALQ